MKRVGEAEIWDCEYKGGGHRIVTTALKKE